MDNFGHPIPGHPELPVEKAAEIKIIQEGPGASLTVCEKVKIMPSRRQHKENERVCRTILQQLVSSIPQNVLTSTSYKRKEQGNDTQKKTVAFEDQDKESAKVEQNPRQENLSGETKSEKSRRVQDQHPGQESWSGESDLDEKVPDQKQDLENNTLSVKFRWIRRTRGTDPEEGTCSIADSSMMATPGIQESTPIQTGTRAQDQTCQR